MSECLCVPLLVRRDTPMNNPAKINLYEVKKIGVNNYMHTIGDRRGTFGVYGKQYESHYMINTIYTDLAVNWAQSVSPSPLLLASYPADLTFPFFSSFPSLVHGQSDLPGLQVLPRVQEHLRVRGGVFEPRPVRLRHGRVLVLHGIHRGRMSGAVAHLLLEEPTSFPSSLSLRWRS